jgi:hypothetical protein
LPVPTELIRRLRKLRRGAPDINTQYASNIYLPHEHSQRAIFERVKSQTMIGALGVLANIDAVDYIFDNAISGCIVECGVWKGGSVAAMLLRLVERGVTDRQVYLFDTFAGMTEPTAADKRGDMPAIGKFNESQKDNHNNWCYSPLEVVKANIAATDYPPELVTYIAGDVLKTLPDSKLPPIALLRLDTDWYESTKAELDHLYPMVVHRGAVIIDDYGTWEGARQAVDEYFQLPRGKPLMYRVDQTRRLFIKTN